MNAMVMVDLKPELRVEVRIHPADEALGYDGKSGWLSIGTWPHVDMRQHLTIYADTEGLSRLRDALSEALAHVPSDKEVVAQR